MPETVELRNAVITDLRACLISSQGGIPVASLNNDYKQLLGETIPYRKLGYDNLIDFLKSIPEIKLTNCNGAVLVEANKTAASNHVTSLVQRQRRSGKRRSRRSQRPSQRKSSKPTALPPPRVNRPPRIPRRNKPKENPPYVPKNTVESSVPPARTSNTSSHSANANFNIPRHPPPAPPRPPPPPLLQTPIPIPRMYHNYSSLPNYSHGITNSTQLYYRSGENPPLFNPQHLLTPHQYASIPPPIRNMSADLILKQKTEQLNAAIEQYEQMQMEKNEVKIKPKMPPSHKAGSKPIIDRLPLPTNMSKDSYYNKLLDICEKRGWPEPEFCLLKQKGGIVTCIVSLKFYKSGSRSEPSSRKLQDFSTYPDEIRDPLKALEEGSKKAYDSVLQMMSDSSHPVSRDRDVILQRVGEMVAGKLNGVWAFQIENDYAEKYNESLPPKWIEIVRDSGVVNASDLGHSFVVTPVTNEDKLKMVSPCSSKTVNLEILKLTPPESDQWDVFLSKAYSYSEVWIRLIGENYSEQLENLTTELELYYFDDKSPYISKAEVNHFYVAICDNSAYRVQVKELIKDSDEAFVHFVDYGDFEYLSFNQMKQLAPKFYKLPAQALQVNLSGLEYCSKLEYRYDIMDKIIAKSYIAVVEERDPYYLVLYDTSENNDLDINKMLLDNIFSEILNKMNILKVGTVKEVRICYIDDNGQVFIQLAATPVLEILEDRLASFDLGESETNKSPKINFHKIYLVKEMGKHKRVNVVSTENFSRQTVDVEFIDEGYTRTVSVSDLLEIADDYDILHFIPNQAFKIYLKDIPPFKLTKSKINKLKEIAPPHISVISKVVEVTDLPVLELFIRNQSDKLLASVNHTIELEDLLESSNGDASFEKSFQQLHISDLSSNKSNFSPHSSSHITPSKHTVIHDQDIFKWDCHGDIIAAHRAEIPPIGSGYFEIYVSDAANPDNFTVLPTKYLSDLNKLTEEMTDYYDNMKPNVTSPLQYDVYAMKHTDGFWYRAVLYRVLNDNITVRLCDYGNLDIVTLQNLRPLHKKFMKMPFVGFKAALCGIAPKHRDWSVQDCVALKDMIKEKKLISIIKEVRQVKDEIVLFLEITDTTSNNDININHQLVIEGRAIYT